LKKAFEKTIFEHGSKIVFSFKSKVAFPKTEVLEKLHIA